ncbi:sulfatase-like hydrolase/transferase [Sediminibacterium ginsengisoli]|uniref:Glycosyltransferase, catalytic subunit of cellulose synthase and poly-beta-1,6-N-acetylglucosamine synthase n=1 Tax=Sediminibacterium ginsengisoli TaxID=413434 RepID=A0A1T4RRQ6_9BACT|nr:sulfatase-like hydrolase/transferase [Sediminibacterium ginsengisoli]SKA18613.1 Glycosyltransferase, catalytic subunit of cellulose synthase and poly-beta-1,6-N-acetylglucosamine synthase [Sediminibacterium ginsengisoli]
MNPEAIIDILFHFITYTIFAYSVLLLLSYIFIGLFSIGETRKYMRKNQFTDYRVLAASVHAPSVSVLAPAYNEGKTIVENVRSLLSIYYTHLEVIVINDGSKDDGLEQLIAAYDLEKTEMFIDVKLPCKEIKAVYKSRNSIYHKLLVVDKVNGGKADALNAGINVSSNDILVCIDVDCILEQDALLKMIKPFMEQTDKRVIATGGVVRIANSCIIEDGRLIKVKLAEDYLPRIQILEYIRAFLLGRMAWTRLNGLMLISGAFGAFDKEIAVKCGGYNHNTVGEDMELVVRMRRYMEEKNEPYVVTYIPDPLCWTEAPSTFRILGRQRNRWIRGTYETLKFHKVMFFNPRYRLLGMLSYPYWFFFEMCAPVVEFLGFIGFFIFALTGYLDWQFFIAFLLFITCFGYLYSAFAILMEVLTFNQYKRRVDIFRLLITGLSEPFYYHPFVVWSAIRGYLDLIKKKKGWGEMTRQGFTKKKNTVIAGTVVPVNPAVTASVPEPEAKDEEGWVMETKIIPAIGRSRMFLNKSFRYYVQHALILLLLLVCARVFELVYDNIQHGTAPLFGKVILSAALKDLAFFFRTITICYPLFVLLYAIHQPVARWFFIILSLFIVLIQLGLSFYFVSTLVPLGADLWGYSKAEIRQTVGSAGSINAASIAMFIAAVLMIISAFVFLPRQRRNNKWLVRLFFILCLLSLSRASESVQEEMPGQEYSNLLSVNKSWFFYSESYRHFFPTEAGVDIYSAAYTGRIPDGTADTALASYRYIDENNFPFLHTTDSTLDVLSPFFNRSPRAPDIVILLVEGLGRAFTNKGAYLGNFTPFLDSLSDKSLYWENFLSAGGRTFAALPSIMGSLPFASQGFSELGNAMPEHFSLINLAAGNGYRTSFYYGGDAHFDFMDTYMEKNHISSVNDEKTFPAGYIKMPGENGFSWGYGDKELFRRYLQVQPTSAQPSLNVLLTVSTHNPFLINEQDKYLQAFEQRMQYLGFTDDLKKQSRNYSRQYASILFTDDALRDFFAQYSQRPDFSNTVFLITGDHRMPEIPMSTKLDRYHVPLIIYSPLLKRTAKFSSVSSHFDITPSLLAWMKKSYNWHVPDSVSWIGSGLDTARTFRNIHAYPLKQTKTDLNDFVMGEYMVSGDNFFRINNNMGLSPENDNARQRALIDAFANFRSRNEKFIRTNKIVPDSLLRKYLP